MPRSWNLTAARPLFIAFPVRQVLAIPNVEMARGKFPSLQANIWLLQALFRPIPTTIKVTKGASVESDIILASSNSFQVYEYEIPWIYGYDLLWIYETRFEFLSSGDLK
ncbi:uncharacterized protein [Malus domestica]|uniref:uncharacterized protein isoform X1 n=1 Tax=Malus domestica TaxID=3750 RepID=UPI0004990838|nr:uncharacterized protein LOC103442650 [Malus domestica]